MEIFHISAECYPMAKVGGLADVVGALPKYQNNAGHNVRVVVPAYDTKFKKINSTTFIGDLLNSEALIFLLVFLKKVQIY